MNERERAELNLREARHSVDLHGEWLLRAHRHLATCTIALESFNTPAQTEPLVVESQSDNLVEVLMGDDATRLIHHRSGCGENSNVLRELFVKWLHDHREDGEWLYTKEMCVELKAWTDHGGKQVVDFVLESLRDIAEFQNNSHPLYPNNWPYSRIRLKPRHTAQ